MDVGWRILHSIPHFNIHILSNHILEALEGFGWNINFNNSVLKPTSTAISSLLNYWYKHLDWKSRWDRQTGEHVHITKFKWYRDLNIYNVRCEFKLSRLEYACQIYLMDVGWRILPSIPHFNIHILSNHILEALEGFVWIWLFIHLKIFQRTPDDSIWTHNAHCKYSNLYII
jgi:hypothetical protein